MYGHRDLRALVELAGCYSMTNGWQVVIRAEWVDISPGRPQGLRYALILQDERQRRLLAFDNSHAVDGKEDEPFDHEHRANAAGRTYAYRFVSGGQLTTDFFERCKDYCNRQGVEFYFEEDVP
jgi:hypothetical protein